jgi:hypothetical protein
MTGGLALAEVQVDLGNLTGVWRTVYRRQDRLMALAAESTAVTWRKLIRDADVAAMVAAFRREIAMTDDAPAPGTDSDSAAAARYHKAQAKALALALVAGLLAAVPGLALFPAFLADIDAALAAAAAEGYASALAVAASQSGEAGFDWDTAIRDGQQQAPPAGSSQEIAALIVAGAVTDIAVALTTMAAAGAAAASMAAAVRAYLRDPRSLTGYLGHAMTTAISAAAQALYATAGVGRLNWVDAGDSRVCPLCEANAAGSPYDADKFPPLPAHFGCRCWSEAAPSALGRLRQFFTRYLP